MRTAKRRLSGLAAALALPLLVLIAFRLFHQTILLEEEEEEAGDFGGAARTGLGVVPELSENQAAYLQRVDAALLRYSVLAQQLNRRFWCFSLTSLLAAAGVPVVIAADVTGWVPAALGAIAAVAQGMEQLMQDQRRSTEFHLIAVSLGRQRRMLSYELGKLSATVERSRRFDRFVYETELALEAGSEKVTAILGQQQGTSAVTPGSASS